MVSLSRSRGIEKNTTGKSETSEAGRRTAEGGEGRIDPRVRNTRKAVANSTLIKDLFERLHFL